MDRETWVPSPGYCRGQEVWAEAVRGTAWKRGPLLGWQVREAGIYHGGPFGDRGHLYKGQGPGPGSTSVSLPHAGPRAV